MFLGKRQSIKAENENIDNSIEGITAEDILNAVTSKMPPKLYQKFKDATQEELRQVIKYKGIHPAGENILQALTLLFRRCDKILEPLLNEHKTLFQSDFYELLIENGISTNIPFILSHLCPHTYIIGTRKDLVYEMPEQELATKIMITPSSGWQGTPQNRVLNMDARENLFARNMKERLSQIVTDNMNWNTAMKVYKNFLATLLRANLREKHQLINKLAWLGQNSLNDVSYE